MSLRVFAHGGGVQSTAALVLSARGEINFPIHLFGNVGEDSENPDTFDYMAHYSRPYAASHGIEFVEVRQTIRKIPVTLRERAINGSGDYIPVFQSGTGAPASRRCTYDFKLRPIWRYLRSHGATARDPAVVGLGITVDEISRAKNTTPFPEQRPAYPLLDLGLRRIDCIKVITDAGLPEPPKSSCYFCPYHRQQVWSEMRRDRPDLFEAAAQLEDAMIARRGARDQSPVYLTRTLRPLREAVGVAQQTLFDPGASIGEDGCDDGVCFV